MVFHIVYFSTRNVLKCFTTMYFLNRVALGMVFPYTFCSMESPKITFLGAFVFVFLIDIAFSLPLLQAELLSIGSFSFRSWLFSLISSCKIWKRSVKKNLYWCLHIFIFDDFRGVSNRYSLLSLVLPVLFSFLLPNSFGCLTSFLWSSRIIVMIAFLDSVPF